MSIGVFVRVGRGEGRRDKQGITLPREQTGALSASRKGVGKEAVNAQIIGIFHY